MVSPQLVDRAIEQIGKRTGNYQYFFKKLASPDWIRPLWERGMFTTPFMIEKHEGGISFPFWPESEYLARMASLDPETVIEVILKIPETDNERIHQDYVDAALNMPLDFAAKIAANEIKWIQKSQYLYLLLPEKLGRLVTKLAESGKIGTALGLMEELLQPSNSSERTVIGPSGKIRGKFDEWQYEKLVKEQVPVLVSKAGFKALERLCAVLDKALQQLGYAEEIDEFTGDRCDHSWIWRPAIEDHGQNHPYGIEDFIIIAVRDAAQQLIEKKVVSSSEVVQLFESYTWTIFRRLVLNVLRTIPYDERDLLKSRILNKAYFDDLNLKYEYSMLLKDCFQILNPEEQEIILGWIETGLNAEEVRDRIIKAYGKHPSQEEINQYIEIWRRDKLAPFHNTLPDQWRKRYDYLVSKYGEAKHPEFSFYLSPISSGPRSPRTSQEIDAMSIEELIDLLLTWDTADEWDAPSKEGLGRELGIAVSLNPQKYAVAANLFIDLDPTYVRHVLRGFNQCITEGKVFEWEHIILLCQWSLQQSDDPSIEGHRYSGKDPDWKSTRRTIAELIISGTDFSDSMIPIKFRRQIWDIITVLLADPDPGTDKDRTEDNRFDPIICAINSIRGNAIHAVVNYALWIIKDNKNSLESQTGFETVPEVRDALEQHLNLYKDPSIAVKSMYGRLIPWLVLMDKVWVLGSINSIFPEEPQLIYYYLSAWTSYVLYCEPYNNVLQTTLPIYRRAISMLGQPCQWKNFSTYEEHLVEHLFTFYLRGTIEMESPDKLLELFYEYASPILASHALGYVGRILRDEDDAEIPQEIPQEMLERIQQLVDYRVSSISKTGLADQVYQELATFGWIFSSARFDDNWAINTLLKVLKLARSIEPAHLVVERLAETVILLPVESLAALKMIINISDNDYHIYGYQDHTEQILKIAMHSEIKDVRRAAIEIINMLGIKGFHQYRELL